MGELNTYICMDCRDFVKRYKGLGRVFFNYINDHEVKVKLTSNPKIDISINPCILENILDDLPRIIKTARLGRDLSKVRSARIVITASYTNDITIFIESHVNIRYKTLVTGSKTLTAIGEVFEEIFLTYTQREKKPSKSCIKSKLFYKLSDSVEKINTGGYLSSNIGGKYCYIRECITDLVDLDESVDKELLYLDLITDTINELNGWMIWTN